MRCFKCDKDLVSIDALGDHHPLGAAVFHSAGNYGSAVYDNLLARECLQIYICDDCLVEGAEDVVEVTKVTETSFTYSPWTVNNPE